MRILQEVRRRWPDLSTLVVGIAVLYVSDRSAFGRRSSGDGLCNLEYLFKAAVGYIAAQD
jgi:hypothetical protein